MLKNKMYKNFVKILFGNTIKSLVKSYRRYRFYMIFIGRYIKQKQAKFVNLPLQSSLINPLGSVVTTQSIAIFIYGLAMIYCCVWSFTRNPWLSHPTLVSDIYNLKDELDNYVYYFSDPLIQEEYAEAEQTGDMNVYECTHFDTLIEKGDKIVTAISDRPALSKKIIIPLDMQVGLFRLDIYYFYYVEPIGDDNLQFITWNRDVILEYQEALNLLIERALSDPNFKVVWEQCHADKQTISTAWYPYFRDMY